MPQSNYSKHLRASSKQRLPHSLCPWKVHCSSWKVLGIIFKEHKILVQLWESSCFCNCAPSPLYPTSLPLSKFFLCWACLAQPSYSPDTFSWKITFVPFRKFLPIRKTSSSPFTEQLCKLFFRISGTPAGWATQWEGKRDDSGFREHVTRVGSTSTSLWLTWHKGKRRMFWHGQKCSFQFPGKYSIFMPSSVWKQHSSPRSLHMAGSY